MNYLWRLCSRAATDRGVCVCDMYLWFQLGIHPPGKTGHRARPERDQGEKTHWCVFYSRQLNLDIQFKFQSKAFPARLSMKEANWPFFQFWQWREATAAELKKEHLVAWNNGFDKSSEHVLLNTSVKPHTDRKAWNCCLPDCLFIQNISNIC